MMRSLGLAAVLVGILLGAPAQAHATTVTFTSHSDCPALVNGSFSGIVTSFFIDTLNGDSFAVNGVARAGGVDMDSSVSILHFALGVPTTAHSFLPTDYGDILSLLITPTATGYSGTGSLIELQTFPNNGTPIFSAGARLNVTLTFTPQGGNCYAVSGSISSGAPPAGGGGPPPAIPEPATAILVALGSLALARR